MTLLVLATPSFVRAVRKLAERDRKTVNQAVTKISENPLIGTEKKGDLAGVFVHKFKLNKQEVLLAYQLKPAKQAPEEVVLLNLASHENFYQNLKR